MTAGKVVRLSCKSQTYAWGKLGSESKVAQLSKEASSSPPAISEDQPYAELWMGTHPNAPSHIYADNGSPSLLSWIKERPEELLSHQIASRFSNDLPFLFKVLSVGKALSIQAHPDLKLAQKLHAESPHLYKDPNHKPEMAIALTPFEALCGFQSLEDISHNLTAYPEFAKVLGEELAAQFIRHVNHSDPKAPRSELLDKSHLRNIFAALMTATDSNVTECLSALVSRLKHGKSYENGTLEELVLRLHSQYGNDVGCFCVFMMNYVLLKPGDAIFLAANEPHAYLSGDCIECMATSDNVVRAGLTPKAKDVDTLINMLTYKSFLPADILMKQEPTQNPNVVLYRAPIPEFSVNRITLRKGESVTLDALNGPSITIVVNGSGSLEAEGSSHPLPHGSVYFFGAGSLVTLHNGSDSLLEVYRAFADSNSF